MNIHIIPRGPALINGRPTQMLGRMLLRIVRSAKRRPTKYFDRGPGKLVFLRAIGGGCVANLASSYPLSPRDSQPGPIMPRFRPLQAPCGKWPKKSGAYTESISIGPELMQIRYLTISGLSITLFCECEAWRVRQSRAVQSLPAPARKLARRRLPYRQGALS